MDLYFSPLACSMAGRIALYETGLEAETAFHDVTLIAKTVGDGRDYFGVNEMGQVPLLITRDGHRLTEVPAVLQYIADLAPEAELMPPAGSFARIEAQKWLNFVATELHKLVFSPQFTPDAGAEVRAFALGKLPARLDHLDRHLAAHGPWLVGDRFTVADAYLLVVLNWPGSLGIDLASWPAVAAYHAQATSRPAAARAIREELAMAGQA